MLFLHVVNDEVVAISEEHSSERGPEWEDRNDWKGGIERPEMLAASATELLGELYIAIDKGRSISPRYDIIKAPAVGDKVSYAFNGDYYPDGEIVHISKTMKVIETDSGNRYYRKKLSGSWVRNGTWTLVPGHIERRNPHF